MLRYVVTVTLPEAAMAERFLDWLRNGHIAEVMASGALSAEILRVDGVPNRFEIVYRFATRSAFERYERDSAPRLRAEGRALFPVESGVIYQRSVSELVESFPEFP